MVCLVFKGTNFGHEPSNLQLLLFSHLVAFIFHFGLMSSFSFFIFAMHCSAVQSLPVFCSSLAIVYHIQVLFLFALSSHFCCIPSSPHSSIQFIMSLQFAITTDGRYYGYIHSLFVLFILPLGTVLDQYRPPTQGSIVLHGTDQFVNGLIVSQTAPFVKGVACETRG